MRTFHRKPCTSFCPSVNVDKLWSLLPEATLAEAASKKDGTVPVIDCSSAGFFKVLGKGRMPEVACVVKARLFSKEAEKKIKAAGGACVLTAQ